MNPWRKTLTSKKKKAHLKKGLLIGLALANLVVCGIAGFYHRNYDPKGVNLVLGIMFGAVAHWLMALGYFYIHQLINRRTAPVGAVIASSLTVCLLISVYFFRFPAHLYWLGVGALWLAVLPLSIFVAGIVSKKKASKPLLNGAFAVSLCGLLLLTGGYFWLVGDGFSVDSPLAGTPALRSSRVTLQNPAESGEHTFTHFTYGSGDNRKRKEYGADVKLTSKKVDASRIIPDWEGDKHKGRTKYWGFGPEALPLNGMVWMPEGEGPFPLVLVVHGNHSMLEYSDPGYAYLGEWLASNGIVTVSVDENFLNGAPDGDFGGKELPARGWLLLKHLEQWRTWNSDPGHELFGKVDLDRIVLVGHSRGGEAVSIAAVFNRLPAFPDNALEKFDFGFGIKGVVALAQTDYRYERRMQLEGTSFLALQGSYDSDEDSFYGLRQYGRTALGDSVFKAGVFIHGANHGQFNTIWGDNDAGPLYGLLLNKAPLIAGEEQRQTAKVMMGAFLQSLFFQNTDYQDVFRNRWLAESWLPENNLSVMYQDSRNLILEDFEADINLKTFGKGTAAASDFKVMHEELMIYKGKLLRHNNALLLGWQFDSLSEKTATYTISMPTAFDDDFNPTHFVFDLSHGDKELLDSIKGEVPQPDFEIAFEDSEGNVLRKSIDDYHVLSPKAQSHYFKSDKMTKERYNAFWEPQFEYAEIGLEGAEFTWAALREIRFEFGKPSKGIIYLDNIGFRK